MEVLSKSKVCGKWVPAGIFFWEEGNISYSHMLKFWKQFWSLKCMNKVLHFQWLMIRYALPVGALLRETIPDRSCAMCGSAYENCIMFLGNVLRPNVSSFIFLSF